MKNLIQDTLNRIKTEHLAPDPKWKFLLRKFGSWSLVVFVIILGALAISVVYYLLSQLDWDLYGFIHQNVFIYALSVMPYFWFILLGLFVAAAFFGVRETERGYRFGWLKIIMVIIVGISMVGFLMSRIGWGGRFNGMMMHGMPFYAQSVATKERQWMQPEQGFLAGTINDISGNLISLNDLNGNRWNVQMNEKTLVRPIADVSAGQMIKIIGTKQSAQNFTATEIRPWIGRGMMGENGQSGFCGMAATGTCGNRGGMMGR